MILVDFHAHLGRSRDGAYSSLPDLLAGMRKHRILHAVVFPIDEPNPGRSYERLNSKVIAAVKNHPRLIGFMRLNPREAGPAVKELQRCVRSGLAGVKLHPRSEGFGPADAAALFPEIAAAGLPVVLHTSHEPNCGPASWLPLFRKHPSVTVILAHGGKDCYEEAARMARDLPRIFIETSTLSCFRTRRILRLAGAAKVVFGSDRPYSDPAVEICKYECVASASERKMIFYGNAGKIFPKISFKAARPVIK
jgi:predicted TIM-barrel fold metal-dependent hydrolase